MCKGRTLAERSVAGLHAFLVRYLPNILTYNSAILDVGCGTGAWLDRLYHLGYRNLYGIDADIGQFETNKAKILRLNLDFEINVGGGQKFKLITAIEVIEHLENPGYFFRNIQKLLDEDGYLLMTTPNVYSLACRLRFFVLSDLKQFGEVGDPTHIYPVFLSNMERILRRYRLEIAAKWGYPANGRTLSSRRLINILCSSLRLILPEEIPGDVLCLLIRKS
ncbi:MAG: methyltransferase domain-containing protein [Deltaproteobacteria bacterium]|nr:methyltransferase domain-containing protein [Deltaproteobacteria bacterium]